MVPGLLPGGGGEHGCDLLDFGGVIGGVKTRQAVYVALGTTEAHSRRCRGEAQGLEDGGQRLGTQ